MSVSNQLDYLLPSKASLDVMGAVPFSINVQKFKVPSMYGYVAEHPTPMYARPLPGNKMTYDILEISFLVTENIQSWKVLHDWMRGIYAPERTEEYINKKLYLEPAVITSYTSANNPFMRFKFVDIFPVKLEEISFDVTATDADPVTCSVSFAYLRYDIELV
jgi:hypothetical protein